MVNFLKIGVLFTFFLLGIYPTKNDGTIEHIVQIYHLGIDLTQTVTQTLVQVKDKQNQANEFYMNVTTVVCGDSHCQIDTVKIVWNELGFFKRLDCPKGVELEKGKGEHFNIKDYKKLNQILANRQSSLKTVYKEEVVGNETTEGVDGMTGATIILNTNDYIKGAVWTCYTLWHWTNSNVYSIIRNITGDELSIEKLFVLLKKENPISKIFALEQLIRRKNYKPETIKIVLEQSRFKEYQLHKLILTYIENAPKDIFHAALKTLFKGNNSEFRLLFLNHLLKTKHPVKQHFFETLSHQFSENNTYQEVNVFLKILKNKNISTSTINSQIIQFLKYENFLIARRAYWFLQEQKCSKLEIEQLKAFYQKNEAKL